MSQSWHYEINGKTFGPVSFDGLAEKVKSGHINPGHAVTSEESGETLNAGKVPGLFAQSEIVQVATVEKWFCWIGSKEYGPVNTIQLENWIKEKRVSPEDFIRPGNSKEWFFAGLYKDLFEDAGIAGAADALIRQLHPELFAKKKTDGLNENSPIDEFDPHEGEHQMSDQAQTAVMEQPEEVQKAPKRHAHNHKSLSEIMMIIPKFIMDLTDAVTDKLSKMFPQTKTAWSILLGSIAALVFAGLYILPPLFEPYYETEESMAIVENIYNDILKMRSEGVSDEEWNQFSNEKNKELKKVLKSLKNTTDAYKIPRQYILRASRDCLVIILKDPKTPSPKEEGNFREYLDFAQYKIETKTREYRRKNNIEF